MASSLPPPHRRLNEAPYCGRWLVTDTSSARIDALALVGLIWRQSRAWVGAYSGRTHSAEITSETTQRGDGGSGGVARLAFAMHTASGHRAAARTIAYRRLPNLG